MRAAIRPAQATILSGQAKTQRWGEGGGGGNTSMSARPRRAYARRLGQLGCVCT